MYLLSGTKLNNRYNIEEVLGHGGFGITYSALDKILNVKVAIKEYLPRQLATRAEGQSKVTVFTGESRKHYEYGLKKFLEEAQSVAQFSHHPNIVSARDYFEANDTAYMVMEYVEGVTLKEYLQKKGGRIAFEEARGILMPVMDALREVHQAGMLHRDISPDNIYITTSAQVKILDFGAARYFAGEQSKSLSVILKSGYAPEEQYRSSGKQGAWTDVYAVGATIYKALTGDTPPEALDRMAEEPLMPPSRLGVNIPSPAEQALLQALAVNAGQRLQTMGEFQQALSGGEPMTMGFQPATAPFQPAPEPSYTPGAAPVSAPVYSPPASPPSHYPQVPRRSANPAAIAAGIGVGVLGLVLLVVLIWWIVAVPPPSANVTPPKGGSQKTDTSTSVPPLPVTAPESTTPKGKDTVANKSLESLKRGKEYLNSGKNYKAREMLLRATEQDPNNALAFYELGIACGRLGFTDEAIKAYKKASELKPDSFGAFFNLGSACARRGRYKEALDAFKEAVRLQPDDSKAHYNLGIAYVKEGNESLARGEYDALKKLDPQMAKKLLDFIEKSKSGL